MTTREDLENELISRLQVASNSTLYPATRVTSLIKNAYIWATQLFVWHDLVRGRKTNSISGHDYYDYPDDFRSESIIRMEIDNLPYTRKNFEDFLEFKKNNPTSTKRYFASFGRQFFINPTSTANGTDNIVIWGAIQAPALTNSTSIPIFSYNKEEGNEAVIKKAFSVATFRTDANLAKGEEADAIGILTKLSLMESKNTQRNQRLQHPMLSVPDFFSGTPNGSPYGKFSYNPEGEE